VTVVNATTVTAVTPVGAAGARDVVITTPGGTATAAAAETLNYVTTPSWATMLEALPDPAVVTDATLRNTTVATGFAWRVRATTSFIEMVLIPPCTFSMGCSTSDQWNWRASEGPIHLVTLTNAFYIGRDEVTHAQWQQRMGSNPSYFQPPNTEFAFANRPVESVSRPAVEIFLTVTGLRLPTEAEWEYANRAGTTTG
jgi:formylglycine-generating enzyme required for sulfatase activity